MLAPVVDPFAAFTQSFTPKRAVSYLRVPGADQDQVLRALASLSGEFTVIERAATLEETMMLATLSLP